MSIRRNTSGQKIAVYAHNSLTDAPKTGDASNITARLSRDGGASAASNDVNPTELDATHHPGIYVFDLTQAESDADLLVFSALSATAGVVIRPLVLYTELGSADLTLTKAALTNKRRQAIVDDAIAEGVPAGTVDIFGDDGVTVIKRLTPSEAAGVVTLTPSVPE